MFGRDNNDDNTEDNTVQVSVVPSTPDASAMPAPAAPAPQEEINLPAPAVEAPAEEMESLSPDPVEEAPVESAPAPVPVTPVPDEELSSPAAVVSTGNSMQDLSSLRQQALHELSPLINHLDQTQDEKYATAKMVYEETNDQALLTSVYESAKNLPDEKAKAAAIYDVIQKINDFTAKN
ncbi:MAG: hypothetical protein JWO47_1022 [Candidatus Saccharibacteria bacterium]|nr:hypothetical protein [Candidatus Saccharibacteria bacterium]